MSKDTTDLLVDRGATHGSFASNAHHAQHLRQFWRSYGQWDTLRPEHREALDMIACKLSRILSGQATFKDHWDDLGGYAALAAKACEK